MERDIKQFILRALLAAQDQPMVDGTLRAAVRSAFAHLAITTHDLGQYIRQLEDQNMIAGTNDEIAGPVWLLTPKGKIRAQQLA